MLGTYDYSPVHRSFEVLGILGFFGLMSLIGYGSLDALAAKEWVHAWWLLPTALVLGVLFADFVSGVFHFVFDTFGSEETPLFGPNVIRPFREHHVDPRAMTRHDFIETNGNNCLVTILPAVAVYALVDPKAGLWSLLFASFWVSGNVLVLMTNQFHKWAHLEDPPRWVEVLQATKLVLSPERHDVHHTPPFDRYYCITNGWLNPFLDWIQFFPRLESLIRWSTRSPRPEAKTGANLTS